MKKAGLLGDDGKPKGLDGVAVDESGNVVTSTDPTGGAGQWSIADVTPLITRHFGLD